jgi:hypothetical protein
MVVLQATMEYCLSITPADSATQKRGKHNTNNTKKWKKKNEGENSLPGALTTTVGISPSLVPFFWPGRKRRIQVTIEDSGIVQKGFGVWSGKVKISKSKGQG